ncbi:MAG: cold-shock protein [Pseudomonadota bacterium]|nr:cold-shock protein [Pseudomonadota bacterium]
MLYGTLKWFNTRKGYGFITNQDNGKDVFVHITQVHKAGINRMTEGQKIAYELYDDKGRTAAGNLSVIQDVTNLIK